MPFVHLASGPYLLLSGGTALILFWMNSELSLSSFHSSHQVCMVIRPGQKFSSRTLTTLQHIGRVPDACRFDVLLHGEPLGSMMQFCSNGYHFFPFFTDLSLEAAAAATASSRID